MSLRAVASSTCSTANPRVTIVTVCLNQRRFIADTLESVMSQTYSPIEHIVIDGGSTDGTVEVLRRYAATETLRWVSEPDRGLSHAFNKGIMAATGEWLYFLNGDDYLVDSGAIGHVIGWIVAHPGYCIYMGGAQGVDEEGAHIQRGMFPQSDHIYTRHSLLDESGLVIHQGTFYRRRVFQVAGLYSERYKTHMDYEFHLRATGFFDIAGMDVVVACFRTHPAALSQQADWRRYVELARARTTYGGRLWHRHNLYFVKGFLSSWPATRLIYRGLTSTRFGKAAARASGWHDVRGMR